MSLLPANGPFFIQHVKGKLLRKQSRQFPFLFGFIDGILTTLTLCTGKILEGKKGFDISLALRVATAAFITGSFVFFVAKYAELRGELVYAEKELNLASSGKLATTILGRKVLYSSAIEALIAGISGFLGAFFPLVVAIIDVYLPWITFSSSIAYLGIFGFALGRNVGRKSYLWSISLILGGIIVIIIGTLLHIVN